MCLCSFAFPRSSPRAERASGCARCGCEIQYESNAKEKNMIVSESLGRQPRRAHPSPRIVHEEGIMALWRGTGAAVTRILPYSATTFAVFPMYHSALATAVRRRTSVPLHQFFVCSSAMFSALHRTARMRVCQCVCVQVSYCVLDLPRAQMCTLFSSSVCSRLTKNKMKIEKKK